MKDMENITRHDRNDWISNMCDDILIHILSLLPTKEAVKTCVLSRRWSRVWTSVSVLKFHVDEFSKNEGVTSKTLNKRISEGRFVRFVNGVLTNREPSHLDTFKYFCLQRDINCHSVEWLDRVTFLMPRVINVHIDIPCGSHLPDSIFSCASLEELELHIYSMSKRLVEHNQLTYLF
jgi:F-box domain